MVRCTILKRKCPNRQRANLLPEATQAGGEDQIGEDSHVDAMFSDSG